METEAKFALTDPAVGQRLQAAEQLAGFTLSSDGIRHIHDVYLDTADRRILGAGYSCRFREQDDDVLITVKPLRMADGAIHRRQEVEVRVPPDQVCPDLLKTAVEWPDALRDQILPLVGDAPLAPLADLNQTRLVRQVKQDDRLVAEMSLDEICADTANRHLAFLEIEVELKPQGTEDDLARIATVLEHEWGLQPDLRSKFERVLSFLQDSPSTIGLLTPPERAVCLQIATRDVPARRRAKALLALDEGATVNQAAACAGFSARRVRYWERLFRRKRLNIFPERLIGQREVHPAEPTEEPAAVQVEEAWPPLGPGLTRNDSMAQAACKTIRFHFQRMLDHEDGAREGKDADDVHDMRVATRRMRAALRVFRNYLDGEAWKPFAKMLRRTGRALGPVRDLDVFREKMQRYIDRLPAARQTELEPLLGAWETEYAAARGDLATFLDSEAYAEFKKEFDDFLETPSAGARRMVSRGGQPRPHRLPEVAPIILYQGLAQVCAYDEWITGIDVPLVRYHQLRIASKRLRYALEFFREVLGPETETLIKKIKALQDHLGNLQDGVVACEILRNFLTWGSWRQGKKNKSSAKADLVIAPGVAAYLTARQSEIQKLKRTFPPVWEEIDCDEFRHRLSALVARL